MHHPIRVYYPRKCHDISIFPIKCMKNSPEKRKYKSESKKKNGKKF
jgi:hypothetical protein